MASGKLHKIAYSIQRTYILTVVSTLGKSFITCDQRIDIPTIEPLLQVEPNVYPQLALTVVPCIELAGFPLDYFDLTFETNEGVTVLPIKIDPSENPYLKPRYVLVLPRGTTGVKSCKIIKKAMGFEVQHNFTFGIMSPPYNYDNAFIGFLSAKVKDIYNHVANLEARVTALENKAGG